MTRIGSRWRLWSEGPMPLKTPGITVLDKFNRNDPPVFQGGAGEKKDTVARKETSQNPKHAPQTSLGLVLDSRKCYFVPRTTVQRGL